MRLVVVLVSALGVVVSSSWSSLVVAATPDADSSLTITCNAHDGTFQLERGAASGGSPPDTVTTIVDWGALIARGPVRGSDVWHRGVSANRAVSCGPFSITITGDYFSPNPLGEMGSYEFPTVTVRRGTADVLNKVSFEDCEMDAALFTPCPGIRWARHIDVRQAKDGSTDVQFRARYGDEHGIERDYVKTLSVGAEGDEGPTFADDVAREAYSSDYTQYCSTVARNERELESCLSMQLVFAEEDLNATYKKVMGSLGKAQQAPLREEERKWIRDREANCRQRAKDMETCVDGCGVSGLMHVTCMTSWAKARARTLQTKWLP